jgi:hypothetical protein
MKVELIFLAVNEYNIDLLKNEVDFFDNLVFTDDNGYLSIESVNLESPEDVNSLINFLFGKNDLPIDLYNDSQIKIIDLTNLKKDIVAIESLDNLYPIWLEETKRENTMDEYGMLICLIGYIQKNLSKKYLLLIIKNS